VPTKASHCGAHKSPAHGEGQSAKVVARYRQRARGWLSAKTVQCFLNDAIEVVRFLCGDVGQPVQGLSDPRIEVGPEIGQNLSADAVALKLHVSVEGIPTRLNANDVPILPCHLSRGSQQRADYRPTAEPHGSEAPRASTAEQVQQNRFSAVISRVPQGDSLRANRLCHLSQSSVASRPRSMFHGDAAFFGSGPGVAADGMEWQTERFTLRRNELHVGVCLRQS